MNVYMNILYEQRERSELLYEDTVNSRWMPHWALWKQTYLPDTFVQPNLGEKNDHRLYGMPKVDDGQKYRMLKLADVSTGSTVGTKVGLPLLNWLGNAEEANKEEVIEERAYWFQHQSRNQFINDFVNFLTYRSVGNPKKLKELISSFVRPVGRALATSDDQWAPNFSCYDVLYFNEADISRVQLISNIYQHITNEFEPRILDRE